MSLVEVRELTKKFGNFTALDHVELTMDAGEICGFIGPNGAGKVNDDSCPVRDVKTDFRYCKNLWP